MSNFCSHCGSAVSENNSINCIKCGKLLCEKTENLKNDSINEAKNKLFNFAKNVSEASLKISQDLKSDENKARIKNFAHKAQSFATEKTKNLKDDLNEINEARKATVAEATDLNSDSKIELTKNITASFWSKLTGKQKGILIGSFAALILLIMQFGDDINSDARKTADYACGMNNYKKMDEISLGKYMDEAIEWNKKMKIKYSNPKKYDEYSAAAGAEIQKRCIH